MTALSFNGPGAADGDFAPMSPAPFWEHRYRPRADHFAKKPCLAGSKRILLPWRRIDGGFGAQLKSRLAARRFCKLRDRDERVRAGIVPESTEPGDSRKQWLSNLLRVCDVRTTDLCRRPEAARSRSRWSP
jgi:hypothetical protein